MNIIIIDATFEAISVLASGNEGIYSSSFFPNTRQRGKNLTIFLENATKEAGFLLKETELIALPEGPGGFTGLRLGYAAAKAISLVSNAIILAIPTLTIFDFSQTYWNGNLLAIIDAKRNSFYAQFFSFHKVQTEIYDATATQIISNIDISKPCLVVGIGVASFKKSLMGCEHNLQFLELPQTAFPQYILQFVLNERSNCKELKDDDSPLYVRKSDAEMQK